MANHNIIDMSGGASPLYQSALSSSLSFNALTKVYPNKGNLVYEYNPFRNYRLTSTKY